MSRTSDISRLEFFVYKRGAIPLNCAIIDVIRMKRPEQPRVSLAHPAGSVLLSVAREVYEQELIYYTEWPYKATINLPGMARTFYGNDARRLALTVGWLRMCIHCTLPVYAAQELDFDPDLPIHAACRDHIAAEDHEPLLEPRTPLETVTTIQPIRKRK